MKRRHPRHQPRPRRDRAGRRDDPRAGDGRVAAYITDFPNNRLLAAPHVVAMPHLGASTPESEQNCAVMAADELKDYLETGNVRNSVNLPAVSMTPSGVMRLCILHKNVPGMLANITTLFGRDGVNVENLSNKSKGDWAYTMVDLAAHIGDDVLQDVRAMEHVVRVRAHQLVKPKLIKSSPGDFLRASFLFRFQVSPSSRPAGRE